MTSIEHCINVADRETMDYADRERLLKEIARLRQMPTALDRATDDWLAITFRRELCCAYCGGKTAPVPPAEFDRMTGRELAARFDAHRDDCPRVLLGKPHELARMHGEARAND